jgi:hypothetical protein
MYAFYMVVFHILSNMPLGQKFSPSKLRLGREKREEGKGRGHIVYLVYLLSHEQAGMLGPAPCLFAFRGK